MITSNSHKVLFLAIFALMLTASCSFFDGDGGKTKITHSDSETETNIPFSNKEPESFQAEYVTTTFLNGEKTERKSFIAKKGNKLLATFGVDSAAKTSHLIDAEQKSFLIKHSEKTFQQKGSFPENDSNKPNYEWQNFLITKWLNEKTTSGFETVGTESGLTIYLVKMEDSKTSEALIYIDNKTPFPVKQEFYNVSNNEKTLVYSVEIKDFKTAVDDSLFEVPADYTEIN